MRTIGQAPRWITVHVTVGATGLLLVGGALADVLGGEAGTAIHRVAPVFGSAVLLSLTWRYRSVRGRTSSETVSYVRVAAFFLGLIGMVGFALPFWPVPAALGITLNIWARTDPCRRTSR